MADDIFAIIGFIGWIVLWSFNIHNKLQYRSQAYPNELRIPTKNDTYHKMTSIILGVIILLLAVLWLIIGDFAIPPLLGLPAGLVILINGMIDLPKGRLCIEDNLLKLSTDQQAIPIADIQSISLQSDKLIISGNTHSPIKQDHLELTEEWINQITEFLTAHLDDQKVSISLLNTQ